MPACHEPRPIALRRFIIADYRTGADGKLIATLPDVGPCQDGDEQRCVIRRDYMRWRATGPCFPLSVLRCETHGRGFTVYPPGQVPYGRRAVAPVALDGSDIGAGALAFTGTLLDASLDAANGTAKHAAWPRDCPGGSPKWWSTQGRQIAAAVRLCGVAPDLDPAAQQAQAAALRVEMLLLVQGAKAIAATPGYRSRGEAVVAVLGRVTDGPCVLERVLAAGHLAGLWGPPWRWETATRQLRCWSFRGDGTRPP